MSDYMLALQDMIEVRDVVNRTIERLMDDLRSTPEREHPKGTYHSAWQQEIDKFRKYAESAEEIL